MVDLFDNSGADDADAGHAGVEWFPAGAVVGVMTTQPLGRVLDYIAPEEGCFTGAFVEVPLGPRKVLGVVWGVGEGTFARARLRTVNRVLDAAPLQAELRVFLERAADYTLTPLSAMLRLATRVPGLSDPPSMRKVYRLGEGQPARMTPARERVLAVLEEFSEGGFTLKELADYAGVTPSVVAGLVTAGAVREEATPRDGPYVTLDPAKGGLPLSAAQAAVAADLRSAVAAGIYGTTLLKGVTGSGKTEVYLEAVAACLSQGRQALVLLPEIALTGAFLDRVEARFGARPAEWHSGVTMTERRRCWKMVGRGGAQLVVGARSALFLPFRDLGLIVVDEEHDTAYKQEDGVFYNARDMAVLRASLCSAHVVLASATPSLESWVNAQSGKYKRAVLEARFGAAVLPEMRPIDMRVEALTQGKWVSPSLHEAVQLRIDKGEQSLLFLNRRGYAPVTICRACGHQIACRNCDARMVEHRFLKRLMCHQCGEQAPLPTICPACKVEGKLAPVGPGVERITEEVAGLFPHARVAVLSSDLFASARALKAAIEGLVGVIDADLGLQGSDLRAAERTFQLLRQVAGRAGRADKPGEALLQTFQPEHPVIRAILTGDEEAFWAAEAEARRAAGVPPFGRLAGIILSSPDVQQAFALGEDMARRDGPLRDVGAQVFGPAPAPIARIRGRHRVRLLVKADKHVPLQAALEAWIRQFKWSSHLRMSVDIDPQSFY
jgi:primosomal protein N' (replication factor Y)